MGVMVEVVGLTKSFLSPANETKALSNLSFKVNEGEFVSIVGPSGCGKTTLLSIISGTDRDIEGKVLIGGKELSESAERIGYMLQKDHLFEWRNLRNNVLLGLEIQKKLSAENIDFALSLLKRYGLGDFLEHLPSELSGGMRQRAALIRTLALRPDILLLDEPFSALDYQTRLQVSDEIGSIIKEFGKTAILVTHDIGEAVSLSDRVCVLSQRPAYVKSEHEIKLSIDNRTALRSREAVEFRGYFNQIWKELDKNAD